MFSVSRGYKEFEVNDWFGGYGWHFIFLGLSRTRNSTKHLIRVSSDNETHKTTNLHHKILCTSGRSFGVTKILWLQSKAGYLEIDRISAYHEITENLGRFLRLSILLLFPKWWKLLISFLEMLEIPKLPGDVGSFLQQLAKAWGPEKRKDFYNGSRFLDIFLCFFAVKKTNPSDLNMERFSITRHQTPFPCICSW